MENAKIQPYGVLQQYSETFISVSSRQLGHAWRHYCP